MCILEITIFTYFIPNGFEEGKLSDLETVLWDSTPTTLSESIYSVMEVNMRLGFEKIKFLRIYFVILFFRILCGENYY
jgi:hypothetical protein